jgi:hypothetical protein
MFCNSHYISRFATFFIDARAKRSFVESFDILLVTDYIETLSIKATPLDAEAHLVSTVV